MISPITGMEMDGNEDDETVTPVYVAPTYAGYTERDLNTLLGTLDSTDPHDQQTMAGINQRLRMISGE